MLASSRSVCARLVETVCQKRQCICRLPLSRLSNRVICRKISTKDDLHLPPQKDARNVASTWEHVFSDIQHTPPPILHHPGVGPRRPRRQTMTAQEIGAFNEIFNLIFDSMSDKAPTRPSSVDIGGSGMGDLFGALRQHSKRMKWTAQSDAELDRKKDEMDVCNNDQELLDWAMREVFGESQRYEQGFRNAKEKGSDGELPMLQPPTYPHLVARLMQAFRDKYRDPHLALSIFNYARHLSIASYVFGCSTSAYNELIATRWNCFRDIKGVHDALEEMFVNGVDMNNKTRELVEKVRREVGETSLWLEENELGSRGVWEMLNNIERLVSQTVIAKRKKSTQKKTPPWNEWKVSEQDEKISSGWEFDKW
ncbi:hypothetical protein GGX14DRAFT_520945 [Mycena pura]|uniref:Mtf2-like C-terminal domain-containing protein n=1 Tax=Mycena pura TaxID=153505 RepID=A0AAD6VD49_9AGAR|nr:hypothetical protein GGX14DRAFT_520945 [Mycena pura]